MNLPPFLRKATPPIRPRPATQADAWAYEIMLAGHEAAADAQGLAPVRMARRMAFLFAAAVLALASAVAWIWLSDDAFKPVLMALWAPFTLALYTSCIDEIDRVANWALYALGLIVVPGLYVYIFLLDKVFPAVAVLVLVGAICGFTLWRAVIALREGTGLRVMALTLRYALSLEEAPRLVMLSGMEHDLADARAWVDAAGLARREGRDAPRLAKHLAKTSPSRGTPGALDAATAAADDVAAQIARLPVSALKVELVGDGRRIKWAA
jgi:hypothetical protein